MGFGEIAYLIIGTIVVIIAAYYTTYLVASRKSKRLSGGRIRVWERFSLSKDTMVCIIGVKDKAYLVLITDGGATVLETYDASELEQAPDAAAVSIPGLAEVISRVVRGGVGAIKSGIAARRPGEKRGGHGDFAESMKRADEIIDTYAGVEDEPVLATAKQEGGIDEMYRRLQNMRAAERTIGSEKERGDE